MANNRWRLFAEIALASLALSMICCSVAANSNWDTMQWGADSWFDVASDPDDDGLTNDEETNIYNTDPNVSDSDQDGLEDGAEIHVYLTNPNVADTDGDGVSDGLEVLNGTDPNTPKPAIQIPILLLPFALILAIVLSIAGIGFIRKAEPKLNSAG